MNLGMRAHDLQAETIEQLSRKCQLNDIHSIQLALAKTVKDFKYGQFSPAYARKIKKELEEKTRRLKGILPIVAELKKTANKEVVAQLEAEVESSNKYIRDYDDSEVQKAYNQGLRHCLKVVKEMAGEYRGNN